MNNGPLLPFRTTQLSRRMLIELLGAQALLAASVAAAAEDPIAARF